MTAGNMIAIGLGIFFGGGMLFVSVYAFFLFRAITRDQNAEMKRRGMKPMKIWPWDTGEWK